MTLYPVAALLGLALAGAVDVSGPRTGRGPSQGRGAPSSQSGGGSGPTLGSPQLQLDLGGLMRSVPGAPVVEQNKAQAALTPLNVDPMLAPTLAPSAVTPDLEKTQRIPQSVLAQAQKLAKAQVPNMPGYVGFNPDLPITGFQSVDNPSMELQSAKTPAALEDALNRIFEGASPKSFSAADPILAPVAASVAEIRGAGFAEVPSLYNKAMLRAEQAGARRAVERKLVRELGPRAQQAVPHLVGQALGLAQKGLLTDDLRRTLLDAAGFWNVILYKGQLGSYGNLGMVNTVLGSIQLEAKKGKKAPYQLTIQESGGDLLLVFQGNQKPAGWFGRTRPPAPALKTNDGAAAAPLAKRETGLVEWLQKKWASLVDWINGGGPAELSPKVMERIERIRQGAVTEASDVLVHAPRRVMGTALGYRFYHAAPDGYPAESDDDKEVKLELKRSGSSGEVEKMRARFEVFNALIESNFAALELIAQGSTKMTVKNARAVLAKVSDMASAYSSLAGDSAESKRLAAAVTAIGRRLEKRLSGKSDGEPLPDDAVELVIPIEKESLHKYVNALHQAALDAVGTKYDEDSPPAANLELSMARDGQTRTVPMIDLSERELVKNGRIVSPTLRAMVNAFTHAKDTPKGALVTQDHQFWGHFKLGAHSAEVYANFLPPDEGGMVRVRYQEWGDNLANQTRLYYVAQILRRLGFHVEQENGYLTAVVDKDHQSQSVDRMMESFAVLLQALHSTVGVDYALPILLEGSTTSQESARRIDQWVDIVMGEGALPFYVHDDHDAMVSGYRNHVANTPLRAQLRLSLNRTLEKFGLPPIPAELALGQLAIDRHYNAPIEEAIVRGDVRMTPDGRFFKPPVEPLEAMAEKLTSGNGAGRMAEVVSSLDPGLLDYKTIGSVGGLLMQRGMRKLDSDTWLIVHVLRDPNTGLIGAAQAEFGKLYHQPAPLSAKGLFNALSQQGYPVAPFEPSEIPVGLGQTLRKARERAYEDAFVGQTFTGLAASPGPGKPVVARITYDKAKAAKGGYVFLAPYTTPDDLDAIKNSKAVVTTSGGLLSHAAITTREMGIPAVIMGQAVWDDGMVSFESPVFGPQKKTAKGGLILRAAQSTSRLPLQEGSLVRIDPNTGALEAFPPQLTDALGDFYAAQEAGRTRMWVNNNWTRLGNLERFALSYELLRSMAAALSVGADAAYELEQVWRALPVETWTSQLAERQFRSELRRALQSLHEENETIRDSMSTESIERAVVRAAAAQDRITALGLALDRDRAELRPVSAAYKTLTDLSRQRLAQLLAEDIQELRTHARLYPSLTRATAAKIKSLVAKAKRRKLAPELYAKWEQQLEELASKTSRSKPPAVIPLSDVLDIDVPFVGGKAAKLGEIMQVVKAAGGEVPPGLALSVEAYRGFLKQAGIAEKVEALAGNKILKPEAKADMIQRLILSAPLTKDSGIGQLIMAQMKLSGMNGKMLAVRSSAVDEDGAEAAFAGAGDTHLYVKEEELLEHVKEIWASLWNPRALLYRQARGLSTTNLAQAVVVQVMADSEVSGIAFTHDPLSGHSGRVIVNSVWGLGEGAVSGRVAPDQYVVSKRNGREVLPAMIADKKLEVVRDPRTGAGTVDKKVDPTLRRARSMTPDKLENLAAVAAALEAHFGYGLDIEWGFVGDKLYILQARPITQAAQPQPAPKPKKMLFVCTGNTCRSPMAEYLAQQQITAKGRTDVTVASRGLQAVDGDPISAGAADALSAFGVNGEAHKAQRLTKRDVEGSDVILVMTPDHERQLLALYPEAKGKVRLLSEQAVDDPYGGTAEDYERAAEQIGAAVTLVLDRP